MSDRALTAERDDGALFVKDGDPVKFCFHQSVTEGRNKISRDIKRHGGQIVGDELSANVLLVDEQQDIALLRKRYYSSTKLYRLSLYVEPRGFVQRCILSGDYHHVRPPKQGMPGLPPGAAKGRVPFTDEDRDRLAYYLATIFPTRDGRTGNKAYKDLELLGQTDDPEWAWARRHTFHSWREHYKMNPVVMDAKIRYHLERLRDVGHHMGEDLRKHGRRGVIEEEEEEEEEAGSGRAEEGEERPREQEREQAHQSVAAARQARDYLARHERDLVPFDYRIQEEEVIIQEPRAAKRQRVQPDVPRRLNPREAQAKRPRVSDAASNDGQATGVKADHGEGDMPPEEDSSNEQSHELEGSDLFGDYDYDQEFEFPVPYSPQASPVPELEVDSAPFSTQTTLIASPLATQKERELTSALGLTPTKLVDGQVPALGPAAPPSPQQTVTTQKRVVVRRARVRGTSAQPGPSVSKETRTRTRGDVAAVEGPYRNTRARSRSIDPQPALESQRPRQRQDQEGKGKGKTREETLVVIEEDVHAEEEPREGEGKTQTEEEVEPIALTSGPSTLEDEMVIEGLLEVSIGRDVDEDAGTEVSLDMHEGEGEVVGSDVDVDDMPESPGYQGMEMESEPTDSDDAETHKLLVRGVVREGSVGREARSEPEHFDRGEDGDQEPDSEDEDADADRIERMARGSLHVAAVSIPTSTSFERRVTRSMGTTQVQTQTRTQTQSQPSPHRTRSGSQART